MSRESGGDEIVGAEKVQSNQGRMRVSANVTGMVETIEKVRC